jgi:phenylpropionate dioxygenase-like ring-hydroxylating dioxygenase large terminal subunit
MMQVHTFKKACVAAYPSTLHHDIVWFWPNTDPQYKDIILKKQPPFIPELEDPSYTRTMGNRDIAYGYAKTQFALKLFLMLSIN